MIANIVSIVIGLIILIIGFMHLRGNISFLHSYHRKNVSEENKLPLGKRLGIGTIIIGTSLILCGVFSMISIILENNIFELIGQILLGVGLVLGLIICLLAIKKYNGSIF